jgi:hypothetical protein
MDHDKATDALCDLNTAYSIIAICEGGVWRSRKGREFANKLVKLCKQHAGQQLTDYDRHRP